LPLSGEEMKMKIETFGTLTISENETGEIDGMFRGFLFNCENPGEPMTKNEIQIAALRVIFDRLEKHIAAEPDGPFPDDPVGFAACAGTNVK
jgi:hypothetical protein